MLKNTHKLGVKHCPFT